MRWGLIITTTVQSCHYWVPLYRRNWLLGTSALLFVKHILLLSAWCLTGFTGHLLGSYAERTLGERQLTCAMSKFMHANDRSDQNYLARSRRRSRWKRQVLGYLHARVPWGQRQGPALSTKRTLAVSAHFYQAHRFLLSIANKQFL